MNNGIRWGLITFATGAMCTTLGHYLEGLLWPIGFVAAFFFALLGSAALDLNGERK